MVEIRTEQIGIKRHLNSKIIQTHTSIGLDQDYSKFNHFYL